jgi:glycosyltransferase involved in cell wall biosynthesis
MPVYNGETYLRQAVASVLAQTYRNFQLLVFDDASSDASWSILNGFSDPRIRLVRNDRNLGPEGNWNAALAAGSGQYLKLFHQDDLLAPRCLAQQVAALEHCPGAVLAFSARTIIRPNGTRILTRAAPWPEGEVEAGVILRRCLRAGTNLIGEPSSVLFRAETARAAGLFDGRIPYLIDLDYWVRLLDHGSGYCLKSPLASFRISPSQWSAAIGCRQSRQFAAFLDVVAASGRCRLGPWTRGRARLMAFRNQVLRMLVYGLLVGRSR